MQIAKPKTNIDDYEACYYPGQCSNCKDSTTRFDWITKEYVYGCTNSKVLNSIDSELITEIKIEY